MEDQANRKGVELVKQLNVGQGVVVCSTGELFIISYPKKDSGPLLGFTKKDLERALELKLLKKADFVTISGEECQVYMKTEPAKG